jgi:hypothetical protein
MHSALIFLDSTNKVRMTFQSKDTHLSRYRTRNSKPKETINSGSAEYSVAAPPIDAIAEEEEDSDDEE